MATKPKEKGGRSKSLLKEEPPQYGTRAVTAISLFSGGGGMDLGFSAAGYSIRCCVEIDPFSCKTLALNAHKKPFLQPVAVLNKDIRAVSANDILSSSGLQRKQIDIVIGGPPCQAFSVFGQREGLKDPRGNLVWEYLRIIKELEPAAFVFENVYGLKTIHNGKLYQDLLTALSCDGKYTVSDHNYDVANFGIPQYRNRIFFIGHRHGKRVPPMTPTHAPEGLLFDSLPHVTVGKVLNGMEEPKEHLSTIPNHYGRAHSTRIVDRYRSLRFGERDPKTRINKLHPNRPSFTIIVGSDAGGGKGHVHPYSPREVTPRESARLQTFPDWWEFAGTGRHVIRQVGNAVPPLFAALLAQHVAKYLFGKAEKFNYKEMVKTLGLNFLI